MEPQVPDQGSDREYMQGRRWLDPAGGRLTSGALPTTTLPEDPLFDRRAIVRGALAVSLALPVLACGIGVWLIVSSVEWANGVEMNFVVSWGMVLAGVYAVALGHGYWLRGRREACRTSTTARAKTPVAAPSVAPAVSERAMAAGAAAIPAPPPAAPCVEAEAPLPWYARSR